MKKTVKGDPALDPKPAAMVLLPRLRGDRCRVDLCATSMHSIKTMQCKTLPERDSKMQNYGSPERNNVNIVCDVAYDITYDVQSRTYDIAYDEQHTIS
jgi:hypothetical protein